MNAIVNRLPIAALALVASSLTTAESFAVVSTYLNIPSISGADPTPGYPNAMVASSVTVLPFAYSIEKNIDAASPQIFAAVAGGTPLGTTSLLFYNAAPVGPPTAILNFPNTFATSQSLAALTETDGFSSTVPKELYLEVPGIPGTSSTPGHPNVLRISSITFAGDFTIDREMDSASDDLFLASALGTHFPTANLLVYNSDPLGPPDAVLSFTDLLVSSYSSTPGIIPVEHVSFAYASLRPQIPEPTTAALVALAAATLTSLARRHGRKPL